MKHPVLRALLATSVAASALVAPHAPARAADEYRLGAEDRVRLRVNEWRPGKGETFEWKAFTGEFTVDGSGRLALPFIGSVEAAGRTTDALAAEIGERLQRKAGLLQRPDAAVEVAQFRPVYVVGLVDKPGAYPYRPQLTVLQAVGLAGGFYRPPEMGVQRLARESVTARGELADARVEQMALAARRARLESEMKDLPAIKFPDAVASQRGTPSVADAMREEQALFDARRAALASQTEALNQAKQLIAAEIETLRPRSSRRTARSASPARSWRASSPWSRRGSRSAPASSRWSRPSPRWRAPGSTTCSPYRGRARTWPATTARCSTCAASGRAPC